MKKFIIVFLGLLCSHIYAHPVAYKGSKGLMGYHSPNLTYSQFNYSFEHWFAVGFHHIRRPDLNDKYGTFASANVLVKRWNGEGLQANLYANIGAGQSQLGQSSKAAGLGQLQFDIEDRDYYFLTKHLRISTDNETDLSQTLIRAGFSPYVVNFDGIHSWIIMEWQNSNFDYGKNISDLTPFLRVFYKNLLFEIGQSFHGVTKFNYITHF